MNGKELFLFGGEHYNGALASFFNDLFVYLIEKDEWRRITSPNSPLPRSGHAWCRSLAGEIYLFGGEFSSPKQGTFYHYNDFWRLDPSKREWTRIETKGKGPPARSGHRMTYWRHCILLFGGFQDTSQQTRYLQDLWIYDCHDYAWHNPAFPPASQKPDARSSFSFHPHEGGAVICGGYSRVKVSVTTGRAAKGGAQSLRSILKPVVHQDCWFLRITPPAPGVTPQVPLAVRWERRKKPVNSPNPPRAGATQAYHKGRGISFGGVYDVEESEEGMDSEFFDQLFAWNIERNRYFPLTLRRSKTVHQKQHEDRSSKKGRGQADEEDLLRNLAALENKGMLETRPDSQTYGASKQSSNISVTASKSVLSTMPHPRFNAQLVVQEDVLYMFGGTFENKDREYTFDEMWAIDLGKMDGVKEIYRRELENWQGSDDEDIDSETSEQESSSSDDSDGGSGATVALPQAPVDTPQPEEPLVPLELEEEESGSLQLGSDDSRPYPRPFESLRDFFTRSSVTWQEIVQDNFSRYEAAVDHSIKELRKIAFDLAETRWWDCREEITALEIEQEQAGIGEVVNVADRSSEPGLAGRRR